MKTFLFIIGLVLSFLLIKLNEEVKDLRKLNEHLNTKLDSLATENFINYTNSERYRIASEYLLDENTKCGEEFDRMLSRVE